MADEDTRDRLAKRRGLDGHVYEPAEDSGLLATATGAELVGDERVIDVGTGSGFVGIQLRETAGVSVVGVDVNPHACRRAANNGLPVVRGDLVTAFDRNVADVIVCNPPYLPTDATNERDDWLATAVAGGPSGREIFDRLLADVDRVLTPEGRLYVLVSSLMDLDAVANTAGEQGFRAEEIARDASFPFEVLAVYRFDRIEFG